MLGGLDAGHVYHHSGTSIVVKVCGLDSEYTLLCQGQCLRHLAWVFEEQRIELATPQVTLSASNSAATNATSNKASNTNDCDAKVAASIAKQTATTANHKRRGGRCYLRDMARSAVGIAIAAWQ
jgi:hypothetical protein